MLYLLNLLLALAHFFGAFDCHGLQLRPESDSFHHQLKEKRRHVIVFFQQEALLHIAALASHQKTWIPLQGAAAATAAPLTQAQRPALPSQDDASNI